MVSIRAIRSHRHHISVGSLTDDTYEMSVWLGRDPGMTPDKDPGSVERIEPMLWLYAPQAIDVDAHQHTYLDQQASSFALFGLATSTNQALAPSSQTVTVNAR